VSFRRAAQRRERAGLFCFFTLGSRKLTFKPLSRVLIHTLRILVSEWCCHLKASVWRARLSATLKSGKEPTCPPARWIIHVRRFGIRAISTRALHCFASGFIRVAVKDRLRFDTLDCPEQEHDQCEVFCRKAKVRAGAVQNGVATFDRGQGRPYLSAEGRSVRRRGRNRLCVHVPEPDGRSQHLT
jgi:hypothetical protein